MDSQQLKHYEAAVLSACFRNDNAINLAGQMLDDDCFVDSAYKGVWQAMCQLNNSGIKISVLSVLQKTIESKIVIDKLTLEFIAEDSSYERDDDLKFNANVLIKERNEREFHALTSFFSEKIEKGECALEEAQRMFNSFFEKKTLQQNTIVSLGASIDLLKDRIKDNFEGKKIEGTPTGFRELDRTNGFHKGEFIVIAGGTSHGKTSFALSITLNAIYKGYKIAYYSLEMDNISLTARLTAMVSRVPASDMLYKRLTSEQFQKVETAMKSLPFRNLFYDDNSTSTFEGIASSIRMMKKRYNITGAVVDYLQILNINTNSRETKEQIMAGIARKFKNLSIELGVWIVALSQLNRDKDNPQPRLDRLRDSGQIAEAADVVLFVYRAELYGRSYELEYKDISTKNTAMIEIAKGRNIGIGKFFVDFEPSLTHFTYRILNDDEKERIENNRASKNYTRGAEIADSLKGNTSSTAKKTKPSPPLQVAQPYTPPPEDPDMPFPKENPNEEPKF